MRIVCAQKLPNIYIDTHLFRTIKLFFKKNPKYYLYFGMKTSIFRLINVGKRVGRGLGAARSLKMAFSINFGRFFTVFFFPGIAIICLKIYSHHFGILFNPFSDAAQFSDWNGFNPPTPVILKGSMYVANCLKHSGPTLRGAFPRNKYRNNQTCFLKPLSCFHRYTTKTTTVQ